MLRKSNLSTHGGVYIGTAGWNYKHWQGPYYPRTIPQRQWLEYYGSDFNTVEINNSFYNLPALKTLRQWKQETPKQFVFSIKASRYITHMKKLHNPRQSLNRFLQRIDALGNQLGPILFQLPPRWHKDIERLESFIRLLPRKYQYSMEFRDTSWWDDDIYELLRQNNIAWCQYELAGIKTPRIITADFAYVRLHGPEHTPYTGSYHGNTLHAWERYFKKIRNKMHAIYCYFDNDEKGYAVKNAKQLKHYYGQR